MEEMRELFVERKGEGELGMPFHTVGFCAISK